VPFRIWLCFAFLAPLAWPQASVYTAQCAHCHGSTGEGGSGPHLGKSGLGTEALIRLITQGRPGTPMPGFEGKLDPAAMAAYVQLLISRMFQPAPARSTPPVSVALNDLASPDLRPDEWLQYGRNWGNQRHSPHRQINAGNVRNLVPAWTFQTGVPDGLQATPLLANGILYLTTAWNHVFAIDARTGEEIWHYRRALPTALKYCCGPVNRGVAILDDTLFLGTLDAHLVALDARTGSVRWDVEMGRPADNYSATSPPLVVRGRTGAKVISGIAGGDFPARGFLDAYDPATGRRLWRFHTLPETAGGWPGDTWRTGGGATWMNGSFDPDLNLVYWGTGNPYPVIDAPARSGDNLYSDSVVALDADSGSLAWAYQYTPNDPFDYDGVNELVFVDGLKTPSGPVRALVHADRNGHFYALDRATGKFLYAKPFVRANWLTGFDPQGRPIPDPKRRPTYEGVEVCPGAAGGKEWNAMAYSPALRLAFVPAIENCAVFLNYGENEKQRGLTPGPSGFRYLPNQAYGKIMAIRVDTGEAAWEVRTRTPMGGGVLSTEGGLIFTGDGEGNLRALDARNGSGLWSFQTGSGIRAAPISYVLDGVQYIAIASGMGGAVNGYTGAGAPWMRNYRAGSSLQVFRLFQPGGGQQFDGGETEIRRNRKKSR